MVPLPPPASWSSRLSSADAERFLRATLIAIFFGGLLVFYALTQFQGLLTPAAMEQADIARHLAGGRGFSSLCLRPSDLWIRTRHHRAPLVSSLISDVRHAPLYPFLLSLEFRIGRRIVPSLGHLPAVALEQWIIIPTALGFLALTSIFVYRIGRRLFDHRVGLTAAAVTLVSEALLAEAVAGTAVPLRALLVAATLDAGLSAAAYLQSPGYGVRGVRDALIAAVLCGLGILSGYMVGFLWVTLLLIFVTLAPGRRTAWISVGVATLSGVIVLPWLLRTVGICGSPLGTAPWHMLSGTSATGGLSFDRFPPESIRRTWWLTVLRTKLPSRLLPLYLEHLPRLSGGPLTMAFWVVSLFWRFNREDVRRFRWIVLGGMGLLAAGAAVDFPEAKDNLSVLVPVATVYAAGCLFALADAVGYSDAGWDRFLSWTFVALCALPTVTRTATGPRPALPPPSTRPAAATYVARLLDPEDRVCTDVPWAVAWYGERPSLLLPATPLQFLAIHDSIAPCKAVYLTHETLQGACTPAPQWDHPSAWSALACGNAPTNFPFRYGLAFPTGTRETIFLSREPRW